jgi:hypothetical protein
MNDVISLKSGESNRGTSMGNEEENASSSSIMEEEEIRRIKDDLSLSSYEKKQKMEEVKMRRLLGEQGAEEKKDAEERVLL